MSKKFAVLFCGLLAACSGLAGKSKPGKERVGLAAPRSETVGEKVVGKAYTAWYHTTVLVLPKGAQLAAVNGGANEDWPILWERGGRTINVKRAGDPHRMSGVPEPPAETNLDIRTTAGEMWSFEIAGATADHPSDTKVFLVPEEKNDDPSAPAPAPEFVAAKMALAACNASAYREKDELTRSRTAALQFAASRIDPGDVSLYKIGGRLRGGRAVVFYDKAHTYVRGKSVELLEIVAGKSYPVAVKLAGSETWMTDYPISKGSVKVDKKRIKFQKEKA